MSSEDEKKKMNDNDPANNENPLGVHRRAYGGLLDGYKQPNKQSHKEYFRIMKAKRWLDEEENKGSEMKSKL